MRGESTTPVRRSARTALLIAAALSVVALASVALASGDHPSRARRDRPTAAGGDSRAGGVPTLEAVHNSTVGRAIVVDARGRTLYRLSPETPRHVLCTRSCLRSWSPLTVPSRRSKLIAGAGVYGRLTTFHRPDGRLQVTLRGVPLYLFSEDRAAGKADGRWIHAFGGVWEVVLAQAATLSPGPPPLTPAGSQPAPGAPVPGPKLPPNPPPI